MSRFLASAACCVLFKSHIWCVEALRPASWWLDLLSRTACGLLAGAGLFPYFFSEVSRVPGFGVGMMLAWCGASAVTRGGRISFGTDWDVLDPRASLPAGPSWAWRGHPTAARPPWLWPR